MILHYQKDVLNWQKATNELLSEGFVPKADFYLAFSHTEETGSPEGAKKIIEYFKQNNIHFSTKNHPKFWVVLFFFYKIAVFTLLF